MATTAQQPTTAPQPTRATLDNVKDTVESIVVAFVLAFVFRAFIVEAFVIPTGSMAVTLYGDQATNTCSTCGYEYARGIADHEVRDARDNHNLSVQLRCPNCDTLVDQIPPARMQRPDSGDRILVQKWAWALSRNSGSAGPQRWDVAVFKDPRDGTTNFIKRLVGLPGEVLEIIDGDIYAVPLSVLAEKEPGLVEALDQLRREVYQNGERRPDPSASAPFRQRHEELNQRLLPHLRIQRKTPRSQTALWFNVYNDDFRPAAPPGGHPPSPVGWWPVDQTAKTAWNTADKEILFDSRDATSHAIEFAGKDIDDFVAYNHSSSPGRSAAGENYVGDLRLKFVWLPDAGEGSLTLQMNRDQDTFTAEIRRDGTVTVEKHTAKGATGRPVVIGNGGLDRPIANGQAVEVEFTNVDYRVTLSLDGQPLVVSRDEQYAPDLVRALAHRGKSEVLPSRVTIAARDLRCRLRHLVLERDVYYRSTEQIEEAIRDPRVGTVRLNPYYRWPGWGTAGMPIMLRQAREVQGKHYPDEYFMLGDNSPASKDSRQWWEIGPHLKHMGEEYQLGTVPGDQLLGKAFFVYWPAGYRPAWAANIGIIPNVGRMRWIR